MVVIRIRVTGDGFRGKEQVSVVMRVLGSNYRSLQRADVRNVIYFITLVENRKEEVSGISLTVRLHIYLVRGGRVRN